jgi:hypothetical protein
MNTTKQARGLMTALGLIPDEHSTVKQQFAIEAALDEAAGIAQPDGRELDLVEGLETILRRLEASAHDAEARGQCIIALRQTTERMRNGLGAALSREMAQMSGEPIEAKTGIVTFPGLEAKYADALNTLQYIDLRIADALHEAGDGGNVLLNALRDIRGEIGDSVERRVDMEAEPVVEDVKPLQYGAIQMGGRWYAKRFTPNGDDVEFWESGAWHPYSIGAFQERQRAAGLMPGQRDTASEESDENAARRMAREVLDLKEKLGDTEARAIKAENAVDVIRADYNHLFRDYEALKADADVLVRNLDGSDGMAPAWWLVAAGAVQRIDARLHPEAAEVRGEPKERI